MSDTDNNDTARVTVGQCKDCGYVIGDDVDFRFPQPARCSCGLDLISATVSDAETVRSLQPDIDRGVGE